MAHLQPSMNNIWQRLGIPEVQLSSEVVVFTEWELSYCDNYLRFAQTRVRYGADEEPSLL